MRHTPPCGVAPSMAKARHPPGDPRFRNEASPVDKNDMQRVEGYLRRTFGNATIRVKPRSRKTDSAEVFVGEEAIGIISEDKEDGETSYDFHMAILDIDLE